MSSRSAAGVCVRHAQQPPRRLRPLLASGERIRQSGSRFWRPSRQVRRTRFAPGYRSATRVRAGRSPKRAGTSALSERSPSATSNFRIAPPALGTRRERLHRKQRAWEFRAVALGKRGPSTRTRFLAEELGGQAPPCGAELCRRRLPEQRPPAPPQLEKDRNEAHGTGSYCPSIARPFRPEPFHRTRCELSAARCPVGCA